VRPIAEPYTPPNQKSAVNHKPDLRPRIYLNYGLFIYEDDLEREGFDTHQLIHEPRGHEPPRLRLTEDTIRRLHRSYKARRAAKPPT